MGWTVGVRSRANLAGVMRGGAQRPTEEIFQLIGLELGELVGVERVEVGSLEAVHVGGVFQMVKSEARARVALGEAVGADAATAGVLELEGVAPLVPGAEDAIDLSYPRKELLLQLGVVAPKKAHLVPRPELAPSDSIVEEAVGLGSVGFAAEEHVASG